MPQAKEKHWRRLDMGKQEERQFGQLVGDGIWEDGFGGLFLGFAQAGDLDFASVGLVWAGGDEAGQAGSAGG